MHVQEDQVQRGPALLIIDELPLLRLNASFASRARADNPNTKSCVWVKVVSAELWTEVRISFAGTLIEVTHLKPGHGFTLGEGPEADLTYATPGLHRLVIATESGAVIERLDGSGLIALGVGEWTSIELGALSIEIGCEPQLIPDLRRRPVDRGWWLSLVSTVLVVVPVSVLALGSAATVRPPIETDAPPYLAYTARSKPVDEQPRDELRTVPRETQPAPHDEDRRRSSPKPPSTPAPDEVDEADLPDSHPSPRSLPAMLQRDSNPVEAARSAGVVGAMPTHEELVEFGSTAAASFSLDVDDRAIWAEMTDGPVDTTIGGLELIGSGRSGGEASEIVRSGAPVHAPSDPAPILDQPRSRRARVAKARIDGELDSSKVRAFANSLRDKWVACLDDDRAPVEFEVRYTVAQDGRISAAQVPRKQLSAKARRCIVATLELGAGPGPTEDGKAAAVVQRVEVR